MSKTTNITTSISVDSPKPTLFLSYCSNDKCIADLIENTLKSETNDGIIISRYTRVRYHQSFKAFMNSIQEHEYVLSIVSDSYLKSQACMYEVGEVVKDHNFKQKLHFVVLSDADRKYYPMDYKGAVTATDIYGGAIKKLEYTEYWKKKYHELERKIDFLDDKEATSSATAELKEIGRIYRNDINEFLDFLADYDGETFEKLYSSHFKDIIDYIIPPVEHSPVDPSEGSTQSDPDNESAPGVGSGPEDNAPTIDTKNIYWVGNRQSDLDGHEAQWKGFVVLFGDKHEPDNDRYVMCPKGDSRRVDHNDSSDLSQERFLARSVKEILKKDPGARFMFYNPSTAYRLVTLEFVEEKDFLEHVVCLNDQATLDEISDKASFRKMMHADDAAPGSRTVPMLPVLHRSKISCKYNDLVQAVQDGQFDDKNDYSRFDAEYGAPALRYEPEHRFVVQAPISSGGSGTFILTRQNAHYLLSSLAPRGEYLVSVYHTKNVPINMHVLIPANGPAVLLPASVQLECEVEMENKLLYKGADYAAYTQLDKHLQDQFENEVRAVADALKAAGYRGVLGVDGIVHNGRVNILEVNPRFQASTELLNRALVEKCGHTLQEMNLICFTDVPFPGDVAEACGSVSVNYSNFSFSNEDHFTHDRHVFRIASNTPGIKVQEDGYSWERQNDYIVQAYLYRLVFEGNIAGISRDGQVWINENIVPPERWLWNKINEKEKLAVKLALMLQGIRMELKLNNRLDEKAGALDLQFGSGRDLMVVNAPTNIRYAGFSPFALRESDTIPGKYVVCYYDKALIDGVGAVPGRIQNGPCDGGRPQLRVTCHFADGRSVHSFSAAVNGDEEFRQFVRACRDERDQAAGGMITQQHLVLDGQALDRQQEDRLVSAVELLKDCRLPIYIQSQPLREETVRRLTQLGVTEFAYNVDVFDEACREAYDPGRRGVREYVAGLENTRKILNGVNRSPERKAVRSRVVVGLEPEASLLEGVRRLIELHVEPALSVFHPQPGADPKVQNAPPIRLVYQLFHTVTEMLFRQNRDLDEDMIEWKKDGDDIVGTITDFHKLGPQCRCCQSDTVSLPWDLQTIRFRPTAPVVDGKRGYFSECV